MKKITGIILGIFYWVSAYACYAADKFDVLPDLPEPLASAAQASSVTTTDTVNTVASQSVGRVLKVPLICISEPLSIKSLTAKSALCPLKSKSACFKVRSSSGIERFVTSYPPLNLGDFNSPKSSEYFLNTGLVVPARIETSKKIDNKVFLDAIDFCCK